MLIKRILKSIFIAVFCVFCVCGFSYADDPNATTNTTDPNAPQQQVNQFTPEDASQFHSRVSQEINDFQSGFESSLRSSDFVPIEAKLGFIFMKALSAIDYILQLSLVRFTIIFLFVMYALWIGLESYKMMRDSTDFKTVLYEIFKRGMIIAVWVLILNYGPAKIFDLLIGPIMALGRHLSDFILGAVAQTYNIRIPDTCTAIHNYVDSEVAAQMAVQTDFKLLVNAEASADIMCLPSQISVYFYHAVAAAFRWIIYGFGHSTVAIIVGVVSVIIFIKCIFKYAFMTLGIVADLFLTLLLLPFTAISEAMPSTKETNYMGQVFSGFLKIFKTKKLSEVLSVFINTAVYFASLAIVIALCAALLSRIIDINQNGSFIVADGMTTLLTGFFILYLANQAEELSKQIGGNIDNSFGQKLQQEGKTLWGDAKKLGGNLLKKWAKK